MFVVSNFTLQISSSMFSIVASVLSLSIILLLPRCHTVMPNLYISKLLLLPSKVPAVVLYGGQFLLQLCTLYFYHFHRLKFLSRIVNCQGLHFFLASMFIIDQEATFSFATGFSVSSCFLLAVFLYLPGGMLQAPIVAALLNYSLH